MLSVAPCLYLIAGDNIQFAKSVCRHVYITDTVTMESQHVIIAFAVAVVIVLVARKMCSEGFASKREKAQAIANWARTGHNTYNSYRSAIPGADIVEYSDVKKILANSPDVDALAGVVGKYN